MSHIIFSIFQLACVVLIFFLMFTLAINQFILSVILVICLKAGTTTLLLSASDDPKALLFCKAN